MKSILISANPRICEDIANGKKFIEFRNSIPKNITTPCKAYLYCTKAKDGQLQKWNAELRASEELNGKVIGEFLLEYIDQVTDQNLIQYAKYGAVHPKILEANCEKQKLFAWHIKDFRLYNTPKLVTEFCKLEDNKPLLRAPQNWCYLNI